MSNLSKLYKQFETQAKLWISDLEKYNEIPFRKKIAPYEYSVKDLYDHYIHRVQNYYLLNMDTLKEAKGGGKTLKGLIVFMTNSTSLLYFTKPKEFSAIERSDKIKPRSFIEIAKRYVTAVSKRTFAPA